MKSLPNMLTLANLFSGCVAIVFILNWQPFLADFDGMQYSIIYAKEQMYWGAVFICIAALFDVLDGSVARLLGVHSPIGKDLDSLADIVSFGVAPSMILFKLLWAGWMQKPNALDVNMLWTSPAFLLACFGAIRLAKFNQLKNDALHFVGMPIPAVALCVATFPLIKITNPLGMAKFFDSVWVIYGIIALLCWLMHSKLKFISLKQLLQNIFTRNFKGVLSQNKVELLWLILSIASVICMGIAGLLFAFCLYVIFSLAIQKS